MEETLLLQILSGQRTKKSLLRCEGVCKRWQSLIKESASSFSTATARSIRSIHRYGLLIFHQDSEIGWKTVSRFNHKGRYVDEHPIVSGSNIFGPLRRFARSRNPLVFYCTDGKQLNQRRYHVYNPLTRHHILIVPPITTTFKSYAGFPSCLGYVPCSEDGSHFKFVLVVTDRKYYLFSIFDSETGEWKTEHPQLSIFDSETGMWKKTKQPPECGIFGCFDFADKCPPCVFLDGDLFWLRFRCILVFRLKTWTARHIELPPVDNGIPQPGCFWESDRRIKYCEIRHNPLEFCIWALDEPLVSEGGNKWRKVFSLNKDAIYSIFIRAGSKPFLYDTRVSAFDDDEGIIHLETPRGLLSYDISKKLATRITDYTYTKGRFLGLQPIHME